MEFIETKQPRLSRDCGCGQPDRILPIGGSNLDPAAILAHPVVHVAHELMEMRAPFAFDRACGKIHVHQHGLATADIAKKVEPTDQLFAALARTERPAERR